jgi:hypothetical protein
VINVATHSTSSSPPQIALHVPVVTVPKLNLAKPTRGGGAGSGGRGATTDYLTAAGLRAGLATVARRVPGATAVSELRLDSHSFDATVYAPHGTVREASFSAAGQLVVPMTATGSRPVVIAAIDISAVPRLVAAMRSQFHVPASQIDYIVLESFPGLQSQWVVFVKGPAHHGFAADLTGSGLHLIS